VSAESWANFDGNDDFDGAAVVGANGENRQSCRRWFTTPIGMAAMEKPVVFER
jgi:hypothetical protein